MSIPAHEVLATCFVNETGETLAPGDSFRPESAAQRDRLIAAGCIAASGAKRAKAPTGPDIPPATGTDTPQED